VILDEPMSGLDPVGRREVRDLILDLRASGKSVFFSSHILQDAEMICDRVAILDGGRLRSQGKLRELVSGTVRWFEVAVCGLPDPPAGAELLSRSGEEALLRVPDIDALAALLESVRQGGGEVLSIWPRRDSLEDHFLREIRRDSGSEVGS